MRTDEERIRLLHQKARQLKDQRQTRLWAAASAGLLTVLIALMVMTYKPGITVTGGFTASSLLGEDAGGYVLVGVISFVAAVCITVCCLKARNKEEK